MQCARVFFNQSKAAHRPPSASTLLSREKDLEATSDESSGSFSLSDPMSSSYSTTVVASGAVLLSTLSQRATHIQTLLQQHVSERVPSKLRVRFAQAVLAAPSAVGSNTDVQGLVTVVGDEIAQLLSALQLLQLWIQLQVPKVEDGNNFGVEVQKYAYVHLKESHEKWQKTWDSLAEYCSLRATAVEKLNMKASSESSTTTTVTSSKGGKDGDEEKSVTAKVEKQSHTGSQVAADALAAVVELDVKWYVNLVRALEGVRDQYAVTDDVISKNKEKIELPRGKNDRAGFNMF